MTVFVIADELAAKRVIVERIAFTHSGRGFVEGVSRPRPTDLTGTGVPLELRDGA